jgi:hypothetical protein
MTPEETKQLNEAIHLLNSIDLGAPVAEQDNRLYEARIETGAFTDLFSDRVDLIPGTKGSGKTAIYRLISEYRKPLLLQTGTVILTGVEAAGDPVFQAFKQKFESLSEMEFENFWRVYFIALILEHFIKNPEHKEQLRRAQPEAKHFIERCRIAYIPEVDNAVSLRELAEAVLKRIKLKIFNYEQAADGASVTVLSVEPSESEQKAASNESNTPIFLNEIHASLLKVLTAAGVKLWIMLDRLDEVFPRRTKLERTALRALLRTTRNFPTYSIRIKLFLRDDIFESVLLGKDGFTALSHIEARKAPTLSWGKKELQLLIVKRFAANARIRAAYSISARQIADNDMHYADEIFNRMFSAQVASGKKQANTLQWICNHCQDGRGVITPRDVIDLLEFAIKAQVMNLRRGTTVTPSLIEAQAFKDALVELSKKKCRTYLEAEFPEFWPSIRKFENSKAEHCDKTLQRLLGDKWADIVEDLTAIGFIQKRPLKNAYVIPFIFRAGLNIRQGKASQNNHHV